MSSFLHFSSAFKPSLSLSNLSSSSRESSRKRKRGCETLDSDGDDGGSEGVETDLAANRTSKPSLPPEFSNVFISTSSSALKEKISNGDNTTHSQTSRHTNQGLHASGYSRSFAHHIAETAPSISKGRISYELATLKPLLYIATGRLATATAEKSSSGTGMRQHHFNIVTAILHRCLSDGDYIRAGRAWAMLLRGEQNGQSIDLRTHDRWGIGAEILMQRELQMAHKTLDQKIVKTSSSTPYLRIQVESMEKAKEYYERVVLQYPYRKAFPNTTGSLSFSIAMFSLWIHTVKELSSMTLMAIGSSDKKIDETDAEASDEVQRSSKSDMEPDRYRKREQVERDTLQSAHEIATQLDGLLVSPPYCDNANFWKLCGEMYLWIADLSVAPVSLEYALSIEGTDKDLVMENQFLLGNISRNTSSDDGNGARRKRQEALTKAQNAFQKVRSCGEASAD